METKRIRQSNMELLRIIAMLFIVAHHYVWNGGGWKFSTGIVQMESGFFVAGGSLGINLFMLISGYFLGGGSTEYKTKRFISILTDVWSCLLYTSVVPADVALVLDAFFVVFPGV